MLLLTVSAASACEDNAFNAVEETGQVRLAVLGLDAQASSAGSVVIQGENVGTLQMTLASPVTIDTVPVGTYHVVYTPPPAYVMAAGQSNEFDVSVRPEELSNVQLSIVQAEGTLHISAAGFAAGVESRGSASVLRTDVGGQSPTTVNISNAGANVSLVPGTYRITYSPPSGYELAAGETNPQNATVNASATASVSFQVTESATPPPATGTLHVSAVGFAAGEENRGSASVLRIDVGGQSPTTVNIPAAGANVSLVAGTYRITYSPPSGYELAAGQSNPRDATVIASATATVSFQVTASTPPPTAGTLRISAVGFAAGEGNHGSASVLRIDVSGQTPTTVNIPAAGANVSLVAGTYRITYSPPSGYELAAGQSNPRDATVNASDTATVSFQVTASSPPPTGGGLVFYSDWGTALGETPSALLDTEKPMPWDVAIGNGRANEVISASGLGFPSGMQNVLKAGMEYNGNGAPTQLVRIDNSGSSLPVPQVGGSLYYRWYIRVEQPDAYTVDTNTHPIQDGNAVSDCNWFLRIEARSDGTYVGRFNVNGNQWPLNAFSPPPLPKHQTFRYELQIVRTGANTFNMHARVYDAANALVYDDDDFRDLQGTVSLADNPTLNFHAVANLAGLNAGHNGVSGAGQSSLFPFIHSYQGGFCVRTDRWCGPYSGGI